jgi:hypothetical protein
MSNQKPARADQTRYYIVRWAPSSTSSPRDKANAKVMTEVAVAKEEFESIHLDPVFARDAVDLIQVDLALGVTPEFVRELVLERSLPAFGVRYLASRAPGRSLAQWTDEDDRRAAKARHEARVAETPPHWTIETIADTDRTYGMTMHRGNQSTQISCTPEEADDLLVAMMRARYAKDFEQATRDLLRLQERAIHDYTHGKE